MEEIIQKFNKLQRDTIFFKKKKNSKVESILKSMGCEFYPVQLVEFYSSYEFARFSADDILPLEELESEIEYFEEFLEDMGIDSKENHYVPIGLDGMGGYYVFISNKKDEAIYWIDHDNPDEINSFENFHAFLEDRYECEVFIMESDDEE